MEKLETLVSVIVVCRNAADQIERYLAQLGELLHARYTNYELLVVDDHSHDDTVARVEAMLLRHAHVRLIGLSRSMGNEIAMLAGLESAIGDFVIALQPSRDPLEAVIPMLELAIGGHDIVLGVMDTASRRGPLYRLAHRIYFTCARRGLQLELIPGSTTFCALSRQALNAITRIRQRKRQFALIASETGYRVTTFPYENPLSREAMRPRGWLSSLRLALSIVINNSNVPLRLVAGMGLLGSLASLLYCGYVVAVNLIKDNVMEGWTTLSLQVSGLFLLVFLMLTIIGEYMARVLDESLERPLYHVRGEKASSLLISSASRRNVMTTSVAEAAPASKESR